MEPEYEGVPGGGQPGGAAGAGVTDEELGARFMGATQRLAVSAEVLAEALQLLPLTLPCLKKALSLGGAGGEPAKVRVRPSGWAHPQGGPEVG